VRFLDRPTCLTVCCGLLQLSLKDPESVVVGAVEEVRYWRASQIAGADLARASMTADDLTDDELGQLRIAFGAADPDDTGVITGMDLPVALGQLVRVAWHFRGLEHCVGQDLTFWLVEWCAQGIVPTQEDMEALLADLNAEEDSYITFDDFAACMARLKE